MIGFELSSIGDTPRVGEFRLNGSITKTPVLWTGHSFKSKVSMSSQPEFDGRPLIVSYGEVYGNKNLSSQIQKEGIRAFLKHRGPIMFDSGGFKFTRFPELPVNTEKILEFLEDANPDIGVVLDHPLSYQDGELFNETRIDKTLENYSRMYKKSRLPILPVLHGYSLRQIEKSCRYIYEVNRSIATVGVGSLVPLLKSSSLENSFRYNRSNGSLGDVGTFFRDSLDVVRSYFPNSLIHMFGVGGPTSIMTLFSLGADSVDSVAWRLNAAYGRIFLPVDTQRDDSYITKRVNSKFRIGDSRKLHSCVCPSCIKQQSVEGKLKRLRTSFKWRAYHNLWTLLSEIHAYRKHAIAGKSREFLAAYVRRHHKMFKILDL